MEFLARQLESILWEGSVALVKDAKIVIHRGTRGGVEAGQQFVVGAVEEVKDDDTGEVLDRSGNKIGTIKVTEAKKNNSKCEAVEGAGKIAKGLTIRPM